MNTKFGLGVISFLAITLIWMSGQTNAQAPLLVEDFTAAAGSAITSNGWTAHSAGGTNTIVTSAPSLSVPNYPSSGVGNAVALATSGEDDNRIFTTQSSGTVYAAFMVNASDAVVDPVGGYFFHLGPDPIGTTFRGRVFLKKDGSGNLAFGISKAVTDATVVFTPFSYSTNTTYLVVVKYTIVAGTNNDTVDLFVSTTTPANEPAATVSAADIATQTDINPGSVALRQGSATTAPTVRVDGIRVGTTWASVTQNVPSANAPVDFNGDGKSDFAVVRNVGGGANGQIRWFINYAGTATTVASDWGLASDNFTPEDFDGDNKTDIAIWRPIGTGQPTGNAFFYILQSQTNTVRIEDFGQVGDNPTVIGDYNGDGKADVAVYRPGATAGAQSFWFFRTTAGGAITYQAWGSNGDFAIPGDFDGDGKNDFVMQRNNGGGQARFWMLQTTAGVDNSIVFGTPSDTIVPGDYDGDGKTDIAAVRNVGGALHWFVRPSSTGVISAAPYAIFGLAASDFPAQGDYDGDGKTDVAIWRSTGTPAFWYNGSTSGPVGVPIGLTGDYPVANYNTH